jgi:thiamine-phosphate pyrophosphorylase
MLPAWRILDANANRAREGLRVLEDIARFVLEHAGLAERCKQARHAITGAMEDLGRACGGGDGTITLAWRDSACDVGVGIKVSGELARADIASVVEANAGRAAEALRVLGEIAKTMHAGASGSNSGDAAVSSAANLVAKSCATFEQVRYEVYELHRVIGLALGAGGFSSGTSDNQPRVCVLLTQRLCTHHAWDRVASIALDARADMIQLREKDVPDRELLDRAKRLVAMCREHNARCVINDRPDIALLAGAWGVHVGQTDLSVADIRRLAGRGLHIGVSTETLDQARAAAQQGADLCGVGPMFPTTTKEKPRLAGPAYLAAYLAEPATARLPHLAIGGITPANVSELARVGCKGIAVSSVVCSSPAPGEVVGALRQVLVPQ